MRKKTQRLLAGTLAVIICITMIGSGIVGILLSDPEPYANSNTPDYASMLTEEYQRQVNNIEAMIPQVEIDPDNMPLQKALGNAYYQAGMYAQYIAPEEMAGHFKSAAGVYQTILAREQDTDIMVKLATVASYNGDDALAEKSYQEVLTLNPEQVGALVGYGAFLSQTKQDYAGAIEQWQKALPLAQEEADKEQIQGLIDRAQGELTAKANESAPSEPATDAE